ncbi:hypothetical protein ACGFK1_13180 [Mycobacterium sp. NPDC048908]|uniref:hypothetical protein n=1 Tax=Mycobacterium sp. NPDC048908 TaxID=3364292 RepID=UPI00371C13A3
MTDTTGRLPQGDFVDARWIPVINGNGSYIVHDEAIVYDDAMVDAEAESRPGSYDDAVRTAAPSRQRKLPWGANLGLALLSVLVVLIGAGAGFFGTLLLPKQYAARAELVYRLTDSQPNELLREDRRLTTQLVLLRSRVVLAPVAFQYGIPPETLTEHVSARVVDSSEIIEVEVRDQTRERAQLILKSIIDAYIAMANKDWKDPVLSYLMFNISEVQIQRRAPDLPQDVALGLARREQVLQSLLDPLQPRPTTSSDPQSAAGPPARILTEPYPVPQQVRPKPLISAGAGAATAFLVAAFIVLLVARRRLRS